jgi:hypothetical protein
VIGGLGQRTKPLPPGTTEPLRRVPFLSLPAELAGLQTLVSRRDNVELWRVVSAGLSGAIPGDCSDSILGPVNRWGVSSISP